jgi:leucyl aminopeptidase (aminopeptidase T)
MGLPMTASVYSEAKAREMAKNVLTRTLRIRPGEALTIETWDSTLPWATAFVLEGRRLGAQPLLLLNDEATHWKSIEVAGTRSVGTPGRQEWAMLERTDAYVFFYGPSDIPRENRLPETAIDEMNAWEDRWFEIANRVGLRLARMFLGRISDASARHFGVEAEAWRRELVDATIVDPLPMQRNALRLAERLRKGETLEIRHPNGTELRLRLRHREPRIEAGVLPQRVPKARSRIRGHPGLLDANLPAGDIIVAVDEQSGEGRFVANETTDTNAGVQRGAEWEIHEGRLTRYSYAAGGELFERAYREAGPNLATAGAVSIGLNPKIRMAPLMKDQRMGSVTFTIGGNRFWGGQTDGHGFHPYAVLSDAELRVDGRILVQPVG